METAACYAIVSMISEKQLAANRANALRSTGPRTEGGKERSKLNACRHHLTGQVTTMTDPDRAAYNKFLNAMVDDFAPVGAVETQLAQRIATDHWRLNRAAAIEENLFAIGVGSMGEDTCQNHPEIEDSMNQARVYTLRSKQLNLLSLYEQRINRSLQKNMETLKAMQSERKAAENEKRRAEVHAGTLERLRLTRRPDRACTLSAALHIVQPADLPSLPAQNGFDFSNAAEPAAPNESRGSAPLSAATLAA